MDGYYIYAINDDENLIVSSEDIIRYDWDKQIFSIPQGLIEKRLKSDLTDEGVLFEAYIGKDKVYEGRLVSSFAMEISSKFLEFKEPIILEIGDSAVSQPIKAEITDKKTNKEANNNIDICKFKYADSDELSTKKIKDKRILTVLDKLGIIGTIDYSF